jgi:pyruvate dehydrogenase E1 component
MTTLGTDGFGFSDTRPAARRHFLVDAESVVVATLAALARRGEVEQAKVVEAARKYRIDDVRAAGPSTGDAGLA